MPDLSANEELAMLDALGELDAGQAKQLRAALAADPALAARHAQLCEMARGVERTLEPLRAEESQPVAEAAPPTHVLAKLEAQRRALLMQRTSETADEKVVSFTEAPRSKWHRFSNVLALAATITLLAAIATLWIAPQLLRPRGTPVALSPRGKTGVTRPLLVWDNAPGQKYDVWILPRDGKVEDAPALFIAKGVQSPVPFAALKPGPAAGENKTLQPGESYRVLVCIADAGRLAGVAQPFQVAPEAVEKLPQPSDAAAALGEALMLIVQLPPAERNRPETQAIERALRLQLSRLGASSAPSPGAAKP